MRLIGIMSAAILFSTVGDMLLSYGMKRIEVPSLAPRSLLAPLRRVLQSWPVILGVALLIVYFALFLSALSQADVSLVVPATAGTYITTAILARFILHERVSRKRAFGIGLIALGLAMTWRG